MRKLLKNRLKAGKGARTFRFRRPRWLTTPRLLLKFRQPVSAMSLPHSLFAAEGRLEVRITRDAADIAAAQALRYRVFYEEMGAKATANMAATGRDYDEFDSCCDHLLVIDHSRPGHEQVVGTYRLLRHEVAMQHGGFYSTGEYDIMPLVTAMASAGGLLELGRSCVHPDYRTNWVIQLLWRGLAGYIQAHGIKYMFGCASLPGTDPQKLRHALSYLHHEHLAPQPLLVHAQPNRYIDMRLLPRDQVDKAVARRSLPPLIKAYLRVGAFVGDGAVIDQQFGTTDVFIVLPVERIADRYHSHFERDEIVAAR